METEGENENEDLSTSSKAEDDVEQEEEDELRAVAKHFGKDLSELTLEALIKLQQKNPEEDGEEGEEENREERHVPQRKGPSLASILGTMPSAAALGLSESISDCIGDEKENGELKSFSTVLTSGGLIVFKAEQSDFAMTLTEITLTRLEVFFFPTPIYS